MLALRVVFFFVVCYIITLRFLFFPLTAIEVVFVFGAGTS